MLSTGISIIGLLVFQLSTCSSTSTESLNLSRSTASLDTTTFGSSSATQASPLSHKLKASVQPRDLKPRVKKNRNKGSCTSRKFKKYRVRTRLDAIVGNLNDTVKAVVPTPADLKTGDATYYGTGLGACGIVSTDSSMIAAASHLLFDSFPGATANPNLNPICGRKVRATYEGKSVEIEIVDRCTGCAMYDLDFSPTAFSNLGNMEKGRLHGMQWQWI